MQTDSTVRPQTKPQSKRNDAKIGAWLAVVCGCFFAFYPPRNSNWLVQWSYDIPIRLAGAVELTNDVVIVQMDQASSKELNVDWNSMTARTNHATLITKLNGAGCKLIVFDVWFANELAAVSNGLVVTDTDQRLVDALCTCTNVVLASVLDPNVPKSEWLEKHKLEPPHDKFLKCVSNGWGTTELDRYSDLVLRNHYRRQKGSDSMPLPWLVAKLAGVPIAQQDGADQRLRWVRYYGNRPGIEALSYHEALKADRGTFSNKIVFVGSVQQTSFPSQGTDVFSTPFGNPISGVFVQATVFLNLLRQDWLRTLPVAWEFCLVALFGLAAGIGLVYFPPRVATLIALSAILVILVLAMVALHFNYWFPWMIVVAVQIPCALGWSVLAYTKKLESTVEDIEEELSSLKDSTKPAPAPPLMPLPPSVEGDTPIPTHTLLKRIGEGGFGEVWLAKNQVGIFHAVKTVRLSKFGNNADPYEREFHGVEKFMPISKDHPNFVQILQVGRRDDKGFFYYVMEAGDDERCGQEFNLTTYSPKNLSNEIKRRGALPVLECLEIMLPLTSGLEYLHQRRLIHRDIKPSNIIFVKGVPKLADIGLVTEMSATGDVSGVGTLYYMPPEGPGTSAGEVFSVGKVLYVLASGKDVDKYPELNDSLSRRSDQQALLALHEIVTKATDEEPRRRYQTVKDLRTALLALHQLLTTN